MKANFQTFSVAMRYRMQLFTRGYLGVRLTPYKGGWQVRQMGARLVWK